MNQEQTDKYFDENVVASKCNGEWRFTLDSDLFGSEFRYEKLNNELPQ